MNGKRILRSIAIGMATVAGMAFSGLFTSAMVTAQADPQSALVRWPVDAAKVGIATAILSGNPTRDSSAIAGRLANEVLARSPVNAEAVRGVAMSRLVQGDLPRARAIFSLGEGLSKRDLPTQMWMIEDRVQAGDIAGALVHYDRALRTQEGGRDILLPILAQAADDPAIAQPLARLLTARPEWWSDFLGRFVQVARSPIAIRMIADGLHLNTASEIDRARLAQIIARLVDLGEYRSARALYDRTLGSRPSLVIDGGFEQDHGLPPFDWSLVDETDRSATREPRQDGKGSALRIVGTEGKEVARQLLVLLPGRYRLQAVSGSVESGVLSPPSISITCSNATAAAALATANFPAGINAQRWNIVFTVPAGCDGQWLSIGSAANVGYLGENPWVGELSIVPAG